MVRHLALLLLATVAALAVYAAEHHECSQSPRSVQADLLPSAEDYEIFKAYADHEQKQMKRPLAFFKTLGDQDRGWVVQKGSSPAAQLRNEAIRRSRIRVDMAPFGDVAHKFMTDGEFKSLTKREFPGGALKAHPNHFGVYRLSLPGYSQDGTKAEMIVAVYAGECGDGIFNFEKKNGKWVCMGGYFIG